MVLLASVDGSSLESTLDLNLYVAGAESNVAIGLAHLGHDVEWFGRVGRDPFGARISRFLTNRGVTTSRVVVDDARPTGVYFKDQIDGRSDVYYYRAGSAASASSRGDVADLSIEHRRLCHVSGITAALSSSCDDLLQQVVVERQRSAVAVSFDVNYRPSLWEVGVAAPRLLELARASDIVVVGRDEADVLWSTGDADGVRELLSNVPELVVKDAHRGATHYGPKGKTFVPALPVDVVEAIGAGDAFAAGVLSGWLRGWGAVESLRLGHIMAAFTLQHVSDSPFLPEASLILDLTKVSVEEWRNLQLVLQTARPVATISLND